MKFAKINAHRKITRSPNHFYHKCKRPIQSHWYSWSGSWSRNKARIEFSEGGRTSGGLSGTHGTSRFIFSLQKQQLFSTLYSKIDCNDIQYTWWVQTKNSKPAYRKKKEQKLNVFDHQIHQELATDVIGVSFDDLWLWLWKSRTERNFAVVMFRLEFYVKIEQTTKHIMSYRLERQLNDVHSYLWWACGWDNCFLSFWNRSLNSPFLIWSCVYTFQHAPATKAWALTSRVL